jgi:GTP cyclohydrolase I
LDQLVSPPPQIADVQAEVDRRCIAIQRVGIKALRHPLTIATADGHALPSIGSWTLDVRLPAEQRGTHMSRFIALIGAFDEPLGAATLRAMLLSMLETLEARDGRIEVSFPFFLRKTAPVSRATSLLDYEVTLIGERHAHGVRVFQKVRVPVTSLCPCSKKISDYGAHNQRSHLIVEVELREDILIEELIRVAEDEASCELWGLLKRADEKFVTERAYENPKFVEDIVRDVAHRLNQDSRIAAYTVEVENFESIHNHSAFAVLESAPRGPG